MHERGCDAWQLHAWTSLACRRAPPWIAPTPDAAARAANCCAMLQTQCVGRLAAQASPAMPCTPAPHPPLPASLGVPVRPRPPLRTPLPHRAPLSSLPSHELCRLPPVPDLHRRVSCARREV
eukprot:365738-Chlamydomonas_euryale.AAC.3